MTLVRDAQPYVDHHERFHDWKQLLCTNALTGRCYWEVERTGWVSVGVTYRGIGRKGKGADCCIGLSDKSWSMCCCRDSYSVFVFDNNRMVTVCKTTSASSRVAVYLDWPAGMLSFYTVSSNTLIHLHTFRCTFTEPLYPAFGFEYMNKFDSTVSLRPITMSECTLRIGK